MQVFRAIRKLWKRGEADVVRPKKNGRPGHVLDAVIPVPRGRHRVDEASPRGRHRVDEASDYLQICLDDSEGLPGVVQDWSRDVASGTSLRADAGQSALSPTTSRPASGSGQLLDGGWKLLHASRSCVDRDAASEFTVQKDIVTFQTGKKFSLTRGSASDQLMLGDTAMTLVSSDVVMVTCARRSLCAWYKRVALPDSSSLSYLGGDWICYGKNCQTRLFQVCIQGAFWYLNDGSSSSSGLVQLRHRDGAIMINEHQVHNPLMGGMLLQLPCGKILRCLRPGQASNLQPIEE